MNQNVQVRYLSDDLSKRVSATALKTSTAGIVIHRAVENPQMWAVTVESCGAKLCLLKSEKDAFAVAGAFADFPIKWEKIPESKSPADLKKVIEILQKRLSALTLEAISNLRQKFNLVPEICNWLGRV
jgi:hypothetical protein